MLQVRQGPGPCVSATSTGTMDNSVIMSCAIDPPQGGDSDGVQKAAIEILEDHYKELNSRKIKDSLSSFLPDIPGNDDVIRLA